jgi:thimet oligopeptidase
VNALTEEESELAREADRNIAEDSTKVPLTHKQLEGLPEELIKKLAHVPNTTDSSFVSLSYPEIYPALDNIKDEHVRFELAKANDRKASNNVPLLERIIEIRAELAQLRGYNSYSEYATETLMTKDPATVEKFIDDLVAKIHDKGQTEINALVDLKHK